MAAMMRNSYIACKVDKWERYLQTVSDWEVAKYLGLY